MICIVSGRSCLALAFLASSTVWAASTPPTPVKSCVLVAAGSDGVTSSAPAPIDYEALNRLILNADASERLQALPDALDKLRRSPSAEAQAVSARLRLLLAQTQANAGRIDSAIATLKAFPLDSSQAPTALLLLAELEVKNGDTNAAIPWLRHLAELFPDEALAVTALLRAADLSGQRSTAALLLLQQAVKQADSGLAVVQRWQERSKDPHFLDDVNTETLPPSLWRLAHAALTDPVFAAADSTQAEARRQLQCLTAQQDARFRLQQKNPMLLADLAATVSSLDLLLKPARDDLSARENEFLATANAWKGCRAKDSACTALKAQYDAQGRALTGWRNRVRGLEMKRDFLRNEQEALPGRWQQDNVANVAAALNLTEKRGAARAVMKELLQQTLAASLKDWEALTAEAYYRLALAQDPRS